jgi:hypothetical protein
MTPSQYSRSDRSAVNITLTYDENGDNLPSKIDGNATQWSRIEGSHGEVFLLVSTADMERDLHEAGIHITETRTKPRAALSTPTGAER